MPHAIGAAGGTTNHQRLVSETAHAPYYDCRAVTAPQPRLVFDAVSVEFGGLRALSEISFEVNSGEIVGLIGPNGAGKTLSLIHI